MNKNFIIFIAYFLLFLFFYFIYRLFGTSKRLAFRNVLICITLPFLAFLFSVFKKPPTIDDLRKDIDGYPDSVIVEYLHEKYSISDLYDRSELIEYIRNNFSITDLYDTYDIRANYSPREIWGYDLYEEIDPHRDGYYTLEEAYDYFVEQAEEYDQMRREQEQYWQ